MYLMPLNYTLKMVKVVTIYIYINLPQLKVSIFKHQIKDTFKMGARLIAGSPRPSAVGSLTLPSGRGPCQAREGVRPLWTLTRERENTMSKPAKEVQLQGS